MYNRKLIQRTHFQKKKKKKRSLRTHFAWSSGRSICVCYIVVDKDD